MTVIVRIQGEGQYDLEGESIHQLKLADARLFDAVAAGEPEAFAREFGAVLHLVRTRGRRLDVATLVESDLILPADDTSLEEARRLFTRHPV